MARKLNNELLRDMAESVADVPDGRMLNNDYLRIIAENFSGGGDGTVDASSIVGVIPAENLPSYVDDVLEYSSRSALPATGETGKIYVTTDTNTTYRWSGSAYVPISNPLDYATQAEAEAGAENTHVMTPLRTKQAIDANAYELPLMSPSTRGGAKLGHGLAIEDGALGIGSVTDPTDAGPIVELTAKGWAEQDTTVGKNLLNVTNQGDSNIRRNADGSFTVTSAPSSNYSSVLGSVSLTSGQTYTLSGGYSEKLRMYTIVDGVTYTAASEPASFTCASDATIQVVAVVQSSVAAGSTIYPQIELGSTATSYEPYSGGAPSPSPSYPQEIKVCRGRNLFGSPEQIQYDLANKSLVRCTVNVAGDIVEITPTTVGSGSAWGRGGQAVGTDYVGDFGYKYRCEAGEVYSLSFSNSTISALVVFFSDSDKIISNENGTSFLYIENKPFTCPSGAAYFTFRIDTASATSTATIRTTVQLEAGSIAHPYVPYGCVGVDVQGRNLLDLNGFLSSRGATYTRDGETFTVTGMGQLYSNPLVFSDVPISVILSGVVTNVTSSVSRIELGTYANGAFTSTAAQLKSGGSPVTASCNALRINYSSGGTFSLSNIQLELGSTATSYVPYFDPYSIPIPLPSRGWVAALPDGTADTLALDGAGGYVWELNTNEAVLDGNADVGKNASDQNFTIFGVRNIFTPVMSNSDSKYKVMCDKLTALTSNVMTSNSSLQNHTIAAISSNRLLLRFANSELNNVNDLLTWLAANPVTVLYPLANPTTESGYVDMPTVPIHATLTCPDLTDLAVRCCADEGAAEIASAWGRRYVETSTEMQSDVAELATGLATLEDGVADLSASIADLTDVVAYHDERIERNASDIASMRKSLLRRESDGYYDNQSVTAFLSAKFDGRLYGYSEPKTTATEVTKTGANAGIPNPTLGTATVAGTSEYRDLGPFQWFAAKGYVDADGVPHVKTIRGIDSDADWDACTDNVWSLRPVVWYSVDESGSSVIGSLSDTWHLGLSPNPQAYLPDGTLRPYMLAARYALGFENGVGVSKSGLKGYGRDVSHNSLITKLGYASSGYSGKSIYEQWYDVFMSRMIYGTKDFQTVMQGCTSYTYQYNPAVAETGVKRVILTNAQAAGLLVGSSMMLGTRVGASNNDRGEAQNFDVFDGARITAIEEYDANNKAVYFDVDETFDTDTTYLLSTAPWHSGSCDAMDWDGSPTSPQSAKEVAFFQGCELMHGATEILAGVIISNDGVTGWMPYVVHDTRDDATSLTEDFVSCGAALPTNDSDGWKYPLYVSDHGGVMYGTTTGGSSTTGASDGHYTNKLATTGVREWRSSGALSNGRGAGPAFVDGSSALGVSHWSIWSRLSGTGRSRG